MVKLTPWQCRVRLLCLLSARLAAPGSSALPGRGRPTGRPATASGARARGADSTAFDHLGAATDRGQRCTSAERALIASLVRDMEGDAPPADATMLNGNRRLLYSSPSPSPSPISPHPHPSPSPNPHQVTGGSCTHRRRRSTARRLSSGHSSRQPYPTPAANPTPNLSACSRYKASTIQPGAGPKP
jgi:hypothetical protein